MDNQHKRPAPRGGRLMGIWTVVRTRPYRWLMLPALVICGYGTSESVAADTLLRWQFAPGQRYQLEFLQTFQTRTTFNQRPLTMVLQLALEMDWQVDGLDDAGLARISQTFTRVRVKTTPQDGKPIEFDSADSSQAGDAATELAKQLKPLLQAKFTVTMDRRGQVRDVEVSAETLQVLSDSQAGSRFNKLFTREAIQRLLRHSVVVLPEGAVAQGDTWTSTIALSPPFNGSQLKTTYTYGGTKHQRGRKLERITVDGSFGGDAEPAKPAELSGLKRHEHRGELDFDNQAGYLVRSQLAQLLTSEQAYRDNVIQVRVESELQLTITRAAGKESN
jgi:hypothetical protein